jgi:hypothetical protein
MAYKLIQMIEDKFSSTNKVTRILLESANKCQSCARGVVVAVSLIMRPVPMNVQSPFQIKPCAGELGMHEW